jgi:PKD repeat protein
MSTTTRLCFVAALLTAAACTVKDTTAPPLAGPSELALRLGLQVVPDIILQDGASQAVLSIDATNGDGTAARNLALRVETVVDGVIADFGMLSAKTIVTGDDGRARVTYTAPPRPAEPVDENRTVQLRVTPIANDYGGSLMRFVTLRLVPPGVILPPNVAPTASFTADGNLQPMSDIVFDASQSTDPDAVSAANPNGLCGASCTYSWEFGDGSSGSGVFVRHQYRSAGTFQIRLTVTDARGASGTVARPVQIGAGTPPTAQFTFSPTNPALSQDIFFNGGLSTAATGRRIVSWDWDFGSGRTASGITTTKRYDTPGSYIVTLKVEDDAGSTAQATQTVTVANAAGPGAGGVPTASFTFSPTSPSVSQTVFFNAAGSTSPSGTTITSYAWDFGDGTTGAGASTPHSFTTPGTYVVRLTIANSAGQTATTTQNVTVASAGSGSLAARLTVGPNPGSTATNFTFDASTSTPGSVTSPIVEYRFRFGDGQEVVTSSPTTTHQYAANGTYQATVTVRDSANNTSTSSAVTVTVGIALQARITATPNTGTTATNFFFDGRTSTPGPATFIQSYRFTFGDGTFQDSASPTATHSYAAAGTYTVTVTITDSSAATSTAAVTITVTP